MFFNEYDYLFRVLIVGDCNVGKTSLVARFDRDQFSLTQVKTIGASFVERVLENQLGRRVKLQIWDTSGDPRFKVITRTYITRADAALVVYDISNRSSFENVKAWIEEFKKDVPVILVGNKNDLRHLRQVPTEEAQEFAKSINIAFLEMSALSGTDVAVPFETFARDLSQEEEEEEREEMKEETGSKHVIRKKQVTNVKSARRNNEDRTLCAQMATMLACPFTIQIHWNEDANSSDG